MKTRLLLGLCGALLSSAVAAAPFLVCDPYLTPASMDASAIPTEFVVTISGVPAPITTPAFPVPGGVILKLDLAPLHLVGTQTVTAKAKNAWGESASSAPLEFNVGPPSAPTNLRVVN